MTMKFRCNACETLHYVEQMNLYHGHGHNGILAHGPDPPEPHTCDGGLSFGRAWLRVAHLDCKDFAEVMSSLAQDRQYVRARSHDVLEYCIAARRFWSPVKICHAVRQLLGFGLCCFDELQDEQDQKDEKDRDSTCRETCGEYLYCVRHRQLIESTSNFLASFLSRDCGTVVMAFFAY